MLRVMTRGCQRTQEPLYSKGHPKRSEQHSQRINSDAPSSLRKKKWNNDRTLHASSCSSRWWHLAPGIRHLVATIGYRGKEVAKQL